jgi:hypothetical protein
MSTSFHPTHKITFTARDGERTDFVVMLHDEGAAYTAEEWEQAANASWSCDPDSDEWTCEGQVTPGGANGTVEVSEIAWIDEVTAAGHATTTHGPTVRPVTSSGWYDTTDGWNVYVGWDRGTARVCEPAYSDAYLAAKRDAEEAHGVEGEENRDVIESHVRAALGIG